VFFQQVEVGFAAFGGCGPEDIVVVGERGEEDTEEETSRFSCVC
jgi:hypothetical protein